MQRLFQAAIQPRQVFDIRDDEEENDANDDEFDGDEFDDQGDQIRDRRRRARGHREESDGSESLPRKVKRGKSQLTVQ